jgi:hypothetical protein
VGEQSVRRVLDEIVARVNPAVALPLPTTWDGPLAQGAGAGRPEEDA